MKKNYFNIIITLLLSLLEYSSERWYVEFYEIIIENLKPSSKKGWFLCQIKN